MPNMYSTHVFAIGCLFSVLPLLISASRGNVTISFYANEATSTCSNASLSNGLFFTTYDAPSQYTCFNFSDIFSQNSTTGSQPSIYNKISTNKEFVNYTVGNLDLYNPRINYTQVVVKQVNASHSEAKPGELAGRRLFFYSFADCQQLDPMLMDGEDEIQSEINHPWFEQTCQTHPDGNCHTVSPNILSFALTDGGTQGACREWKLQGRSHASALSRHSGSAVMGLGGLVALWIML